VRRAEFVTEAGRQRAGESFTVIYGGKGEVGTRGMLRTQRRATLGAFRSDAKTLRICATWTTRRWARSGISSRRTKACRSGGVG